MDEKIDGLPVKGYRPQPPEAVAAVNRLKQIEADLLAALDEIGRDPVLDVDARWLAIGRTDIQKGFMAANRSIFKPGA